MLFLQSAPHPALQPYISRYFFVSIETAQLPSLTQIFPPYDIPNLTFWDGPVWLQHSPSIPATVTTGKLSKIDTPFFAGMVTAPFHMIFGEKATVTALAIVFKPSGFGALFCRDMIELTDLLPDLGSLVGASQAEQLTNQLSSAPDFKTKVSLLDAFFLNRLVSPPPQAIQIRMACQRLIVSHGLESMNDLADHTNMSLRTLERRFAHQVGLPPKTFARLKRFHHAFSLLLDQTSFSGSAAAHQCGYFDQAHLIKEFNVFAGYSPSSILPPDYFLFNQFILQAIFPAF